MADRDYGQEYWEKLTEKLAKKANNRDIEPQKIEENPPQETTHKEQRDRANRAFQDWKIKQKSQYQKMGHPLPQSNENANLSQNKPLSHPSPTTNKNLTQNQKI